MKKIKFSFLAIVALLAMSFTVATHKGTFAKLSKKPAQVFVCETDLGRNKFFQAYTQCPTMMVYQRGQSPCPPVGHFQFDCGRNLIQNPMGVPCPGGARFCCAVLMPGVILCPPNCASVQVFCMP